MTIISTTAEKSKQVVGMFNPKTWKEKGWLWTTNLFITTYIIVVIILQFYWGREPEVFDVVANAQEVATNNDDKLVNGYTTTATLITLVHTLLEKTGGYLSNDVMPPGVFMDNIPEWEFGVLVQIRDMSRAMRNDFSRSQSQSIEDKDLIVAEPQFHFNSDSWILPATEGEYRKGLKALERYLNRLAKVKQHDAQFFSRADNLRDWLAQVDKRLGSLSQRLSASVGQDRINTDLAGDSHAEQSTATPLQRHIKTPWIKIDNVFYEARGQSWALLHLLKAVEQDFKRVLEKKNAVISLQQIIRELEAAQQAIWSPIILNGNGFGLVANHSLVMASYISRANAAVIDLKTLLREG